MQFLSSICGILPVSPLLFPHRKGSSPGTGRGSSPQCQRQLMTQPWAEAVSWIYFGFQTSLPPCSHLYSWEGSGPYPELDFPPSPRAGNAGWGYVGPASAGHSGMWPRIRSTWSRQALTAALISPTTQSWQIPAQPGSGPVMSPQSHAGSPCALIPALKNSCY